MKEERRNQGVKLVETKCEQKNEEENRKKKNKGCEMMNKYKNSNAVQFSGTNKAVNIEQINKRENNRQSGETCDKALRCNLAAQFERENSEREVVPRRPGGIRKYIEQVKKEISKCRRVASEGLMRLKQDVRDLERDIERIVGKIRGYRGD